MECRLLQHHGRCDVEKVENPWRIVRCLDRDSQRFEVVPGPPQALDFLGVLAGGRLVMFDAKSTGNATRFDFSHITDEQLRRARRYARLGAAVFFHVERRHPLFRRDWHILPVDPSGAIAGIWHKRCSGEMPPGAEQRESIGWSDAEAWRVRGGEMWLDAWVRLVGDEARTAA